ncbi:MAG: UDP-N-acetylglucosamine pyrophosphorylase [Verrucomicrobiota bacterium]
MKQGKIDEWHELGVSVGDEVDISRIAADAVIHPGCRIRGEKTSIGPGSVVGEEAPATVDNCQLGRNVRLKGGSFSGATFFDGANMGSGAHVRAGTILEEEANGAHTAGFKQTLLMPFVTTGSLINFCDILMAGGTSRKDHSEVGSSYIHFNFTPHQDKATASLVGDVPHGVFLDRKPIFLGGQGGLVGPSRMAYGSVVAAGGVCRKDLLEENQLHIPATPKKGTRPYEAGVYRNIDRIVKNNLVYIGNILALREWYRNVRTRFVRDAFDQAVLDGGLDNLDLVLAERIKRLGDLAGKMKYSFQWLEANGGSVELVDAQKRFHAAWPEMKLSLKQETLMQDVQLQESFLDGFAPAGSYIETIQSIEPSSRESGCGWLQSIVDGVEQLWR